MMGAQVISNPGRTAFNVDELESSTVFALLRFDSLQEDTKGATVSYRHDVLRGLDRWFHAAREQRLAERGTDGWADCTGLARCLEIAARLALD